MTDGVRPPRYRGDTVTDSPDVYVCPACDSGDHVSINVGAFGADEDSEICCCPFCECEATISADPAWTLGDHK